MLKRNIAVVVLAALVLGVGAYAWAEGAPARPASATATAMAGVPAVGGPADAALRPMRPAGRALLRRGVHGDVIVKDKNGTFVTVTFDKGKVTGHTGSSITVERPDGKSVTLTLDAATTYRGIASAADIRDGKGAIVVSKGGTATTVAQRPATAGTPSA
ncbi:MAG: hypothetical protein JWO37_3967 [Acidimicrobiales bacterium]|nr:hypothetical protein [Acidimicrobiales bacterium]